MLCVTLYFVVRYASSMCMYCNVLLVNQRGGESLGQLGEGLGRTGGWRLAREEDHVWGCRGMFWVRFLPLITRSSDVVLLR